MNMNHPFELRQNKPNFIRHSLVAFVAASAKEAGEGGFKKGSLTIEIQARNCKITGTEGRCSASYKWLKYE